MKIEVVTTINEFLSLIHKTEYFNNNWYRGHKNTEYRLEPSLYRNKKEVITGDDTIQFRHYELEDEALAIKEFKKSTLERYINQELSDIDYLYLMQHNGIDTRLLDFTTNPLIALFFSVVGSKDVCLKNERDSDFENEFNTECSAVFCINPKTINHYSFDTDKTIDLSSVKFKAIKNLMTPICIQPSNTTIDERLKKQNGKFILFGKEVNPIDWYSIFSNDILKILIPNSKRERILQSLDKKFNINYSTIYPDMEGVKLQVKQTVKNKYKKI